MNLRTIYDKENSKIFYSDTDFLLLPYPYQNQLIIKVQDKHSNEIFAFTYLNNDIKRVIWRMLKKIIAVQKEFKKEQINKDFIREEYYIIKKTWSFSFYSLIEDSKIQKEKLEKSFKKFWSLLIKGSNISLFDVLVTLQKRDNKLQVVKTVIIPCKIEGD